MPACPPFKNNKTKQNKPACVPHESNISSREEDGAGCRPAPRAPLKLWANPSTADGPHGHEGSAAPHGLSGLGLSWAREAYCGLQAPAAVVYTPAVMLLLLSFNKKRGRQRKRNGLSKQEENSLRLLCFANTALFSQPVPPLPGEAGDQNGSFVPVPGAQPQRKSSSGNSAARTAGLGVGGTAPPPWVLHQHGVFGWVLQPPARPAVCAAPEVVGASCLTPTPQGITALHPCWAQRCFPIAVHGVGLAGP